MLSKIIRLIAETTRRGPAPASPNASGLGEVWSRRITEKDRLVYDVESDVLTIVACCFHHDDQ